tara:strand:- start:2412 stop:3047 length:636 start_codon:yes stop_codon:yes gene_type:complete
MDLKERIKVALGIDTEEQEVKLAYEAKLADGTIIVSEADELAEGVVLNILSEDGEQTPMPEGTYSLEDGTEFSTDANGVVTEVSAKEEEVEQEEETEEVEMEEEATTEDTMLEEVGNVVRELLENVTSELNTIKAELDELRGENLAKDENIVDLQSENIELSKQVEDLGSEPSAEPVKARKFASNTPKMELSRADYMKLSAQEKYLYNLNK